MLLNHLIEHALIQGSIIQLLELRGQAFAQCNHVAQRDIGAIDGRQNRICVDGRVAIGENGRGEAKRGCADQEIFHM